MIEFAIGAPLILTVALYGIETANLTLTHMRVTQTAIHVADNASRIGDTSMLEQRKIYEADINDLLLGAKIQFSSTGPLYENGRIILSSLEPNTASSVSGGQFIHWQRCKGKKKFKPVYGKEGDGLSYTMTGMGPVGQKVYALPGEAVMFVEIAYDYQPLFADWFIQNKTLTAYAAYTVRSDRDLSKIYQLNESSPDPAQNCSVNDDFPDTTP